MKKRLLFLCGLSYFILLLACDGEKKKDYSNINTKTGQKPAQAYVGDQNCVYCHKEQNGLWMGSHHQLAMQEANASTVLGDFTQKNLVLDGVTYDFEQKVDSFSVRIQEIDGSVKEYQITYCFGLEPLQQYMIDFDGGRKQVLRASWDTENQRWFHQYEGDLIQPNDWLHWTRGGQNWNTMCAECHSTDLKKNYDLQTDTFNTEYALINVSCEACHGPGKEHVDWASGTKEKSDQSLYAGNTQISQMNMCAPCHARRVKLTADLEPGTAFEDQYMVQTINTDFYHADGQILEEDYVYGSFLQSKMYAEGVRCSDCHNAHSLEMKFEGNKLCTQCHLPEDYDSQAHHFHQMGTKGASCVECHMTGRYYMGNDFRRDHSFRIPRPDQSIAYGTPNACNECHEDKSEKWASNWIEKWYGKKRQPHFSDPLLESQEATLSTDQRIRLYGFINDLNYPEIARATAINYLTYTGQEGFEALLNALEDSSALVRYNALMQFRGLPIEQRRSVALKLIQDETKLVRVGAAQLLIDDSGDGLQASDQMNLSSANAEFEAMLFANADFSAGRLQLGDYYLQKNDLQQAIINYEAALKKDSLLLPVYSNLATAYSLVGKTNQAFETLDAWIEYDPNNARPWYLKGLLHFEVGNPELALEDMYMSIELNPEDTRARYNLATYWYQNQDFEKALQFVDQSLKFDPENPDFLYLKALILRGLGNNQGAAEIMQRLNS